MVRRRTNLNCPTGTLDVLFQYAGFTWGVRLQLRRDVPVEPGEPAEVNVEGHYLGPMLDGQGGEVGIVDLVACSPQRRQQAVQEAEVAGGRLKEDRGRLRQPGFHYTRRLLQRQGNRKHGTSGPQAEEREQHDPRKTNRLPTAEGALQPAPGCGMMPSILVDGVDENAGVDDLHRVRLLACGQR